MLILTLFTGQAIYRKLNYLSATFVSIAACFHNYYRITLALDYNAYTSHVYNIVATIYE